MDNGGIPQDTLSVPDMVSAANAGDRLAGLILSEAGDRLGEKRWKWRRETSLSSPRRWTMSRPRVVTSSPGRGIVGGVVKRLFPGDAFVRIAVRPVILAVLLANVLFSWSCVLPGTATLHLVNNSGKAIVHVYWRPQGELPWGVDRLNLTSIDQTIANGASDDFQGIEPGWYDIRVEYFDSSSSQQSLALAENTYQTLTFT